MPQLFYFLLLTLSGFVLHAHAQTAAQLTASQVLDSSLAFCGGEKLDALQASELSYTFFQKEGQPVSVVDVRKPGAAYTQSVLAKEYGPQTTFFNGKQVTVANDKGVTHFGAPERVIPMQLRLYHLPQQAYKKLAWKLERLADEQFEHINCYVVRATAPNGYIPPTFLISAISSCS